MGVAGLWDIIRPAGQTRSLTHLSVVDGFEANPDGKRGFRVGIDASIWFFHAAYGKEGENPELRTLFFRCATLMRSPFLPLFVFDGPKRPSVKRGKRIGKNNHWLTTGMKNIINAFGFEWRTAPGEAEAELAYLNRIGIIDGVLSDDVDNFLFGAKVVIRNSSNTLSGNRANPVKNSVGKDDKNHTVIYRLKDISERPDINLTRGGFILIGLLSGGDYHQAGLPRCGTVIAHGLAKCGFGDSLYQAALSHSPDALPAFLANWRNELRHQLRTNSQGHLSRKSPSLAKSVPEDFPDIDILLSYTSPITSETEGRANNNLKLTWNKEPDLGQLAALCELYFEWGVKETIIKRFRTIIWPSAVLRILRRAAIDVDERSKADMFPTTPRKKGEANVAQIGTPSKMITKYFSSMRINPASDDVSPTDEPLIVKIHSTRQHASTDGILEYRLEIAPAQLVRFTGAGVKGTRPPVEADEWDDDEDEEERRSKKAPPDPFSHLRVWMPASMVRMVEPDLVDQFEGVRENKRNKKARGATSKGKASVVAEEEEEESSSADEKVAQEKVTQEKITSPRTSDKHKMNVGVTEDDNDAMRTGLKTFFGVSKGTKNMKSKPSAKSTRLTAPAGASKDAAAKVSAKRPVAAEFSEFSDSIEFPSIGSSSGSAPLATKSASRTYVPMPGSEVEVDPRSKAFPSSPDKVAPLQADDLFTPGPSKRPEPKEVRRKCALPSSDVESYSSSATKSTRSTSTASRCDVVSDSEKSPPPLSQRPKPRPFPILFDKASPLHADETPSPTVPKPKPIHIKSNLQRSRRTNLSQIASDGTPVDSNHVIYYPSDEEENNKNVYLRPSSPSPIRHRAGPAAPKVMAVIEISSDSDTPPSSLKMPPLLAAKAKARSKTRLLSPTCSKEATTPRPSVEVSDGLLDDIIDLT